MKGMVYGGVIDEATDRNYGRLLRERTWARHLTAITIGRSWKSRKL